MQGQDLIDQLGKVHMSWGLGSADRWDLDQTTGLITWTFPDKTATAPAQIIGSHNPGAGTWMWASTQTERYHWTEPRPRGLL
ncbi:DUF6882 domain-containing protein [Nocardia asteroides]|uniref:DUF6882 domain-containing protein n=1 Tax=Nocardia asteroides TaxID=1824 RepID=UPI003F4D1E38